jgi:hypothetical protein
MFAATLNPAHADAQLRFEQAPDGGVEIYAVGSAGGDGARIASFGGTPAFAFSLHGSLPSGIPVQVGPDGYLVVNKD